MFCNVQCSEYPLQVKRQNSILALFWLMGFWPGSLFGWGSREVFLLLLFHNELVPTSRLGLFLLFFVPIILAIIGLLFRSRLFLYSIAVVEGLCFGTVLIGLSFCNLSCGWLIATILLAPRYLLLIPQFLFWSKCLTVSSLRPLVRIVPLIFVLIAFAIAIYQSFSSFAILLLEHF